MSGRNLLLCTINEECRNIVHSGLNLDRCEARDSSSAPGASPAANEPVEDKRPPHGLTETTPLAPICAPPYPDESRRGDLKEQTAHTARAVLTTPFAVDPPQMPPAYMTDVSPTQSRWTSRESTSASDATGPGEEPPTPAPITKPGEIGDRQGSVS